MSGRPYNDNTTTASTTPKPSIEAASTNDLLLADVDTQADTQASYPWLTNAGSWLWSGLSAVTSAAWRGAQWAKESAYSAGSSIRESGEQYESDQCAIAQQQVLSHIKSAVVASVKDYVDTAWAKHRKAVIAGSVTAASTAGVITAARLYHRFK